jgi:hypothetical protein
MITAGFYIVDDTIKYMQARNILEERLIFNGTDGWSRDWKAAFRYETAELAIERARALQTEAPVKILQIQPNGNNIGVGEIRF